MTVPSARAMPSERNRRSFSYPPAPPRRGTRRRPGTRARRGPTAALGRRAGDRDLAAIIRHSSICVTFRLCVQPLDFHARAVSGMSRDASGPDAPSTFEDVAPERVVVAKPHAGPRLPRRPLLGSGQVEPDVAHWPHERVVLEQLSLPLERPPNLLGPVRRAEARPRDEVRRPARSPTSGRSGAASGARRPRRDRPAASRRGVAREPRCGAPLPG